MDKGAVQTFFGFPSYQHRRALAAKGGGKFVSNGGGVLVFSDIPRNYRLSRVPLI